MKQTMGTQFYFVLLLEFILQNCISNEIAMYKIDHCISLLCGFLSIVFKVEEVFLEILSI